MSKYIKILLLAAFVWFSLVFLYSLIFNNEVDIFALSIAVITAGLRVFDYFFFKK